jgi:hypothetical protein
MDYLCWFRVIGAIRVLAVLGLAASRPAVSRTVRKQPEHGYTEYTETTRICSGCVTTAADTVTEYFNASVSDANGSLMRRISSSTWAMPVLLGVSAVSVTQQVRETFFYSNGREAFESEPVLSLPVAFAGQSVRISEALPHVKDWDDPGESYPVHRTLAALGDQSPAVYPFQFRDFLAVLLLPLTGPWIGLGASLVVLGIKTATGRWYLGSPLNE